MDPVARLAERPERGAILLDVDGTLAPIVPRPADAVVPEETRGELERLAGRYALVGCVSGRAGDDAARIVGLPQLVYVGNHGLELDPDAAAWEERLTDLVATTDWPVEDKRLTASFHYRDAEDEQAARAQLEEAAARARSAGFVTRWGRKVLEVLPPLEGNKGAAIRRLLDEHGLGRALYAGDDTTDLDAFAAVAELELGVRVAVASTEGPRELREAADIVVDGPAGLLELLRRL